MENDDQVRDAVGDYLERMPGELAEEYAALVRAFKTLLDAFPVRHFSPVGAYQLERYLNARKPKVVYVEGPARANHLIPLLQDTRARFPLAIYSFAEIPDAPLGGEALPELFYPYADFSPELVALRWAARNGVPALFVDCSLEEFISMERERGGPAGGGAGPEDPTSDFLRLTCEKSGLDSFEEVWDYFFEAEGHLLDPETFRAAMLLFTLAIKGQGSTISLDEARDRFMRATVARDLEERGLSGTDALLVCGALHATTIPLMATGETHDPLPHPAPVRVTHALIPYSFPRLSSGTGYLSGVEAPAYYQLVHEKLREGKYDGRRVVLELLVRARALHQERSGGTGMPSTADVIAAHQAAVHMAAMKGKRFPTRHDLLVGLELACDKELGSFGDPMLWEVVGEVLVGTKVGVLPPGAGEPPIIREFKRKVSRFGLPATDREEEVTLSLDGPLQRRASAFLHRLASLGVPYARAVSVATPEDPLLRTETWNARLSPFVEAKLVDLAATASSVREGALQWARQKLALAVRVNGAAEAVLAAARMALPELAREALNRARELLLGEAELATLVSTLVHLSNAWTARAFDPDLVPEETCKLARDCFYQACARLADGSGLEPAAGSVGRSLEALDSLVALFSLPDTFPSLEFDVAYSKGALSRACANCGDPVLRGGVWGVAVARRVVDQQALAGELTSYARGSASRMAQLGEFLVGLLRTNRGALFGESPALEALHQVVVGVSWEDFLLVAPFLRRAFGSLTGAERERLAGEVARLSGATRASELLAGEVEIGRVSEAEAREMRELEGEVDDLMDKLGM
ncbi:MAG: hypothetical protein Kow0069_16210 [Promethearchaeota archaeon]